VSLAQPGEVLRCGTVYVGPPDRHIIITADARVQIIDRPQLRHRPSADWLFESVAGTYGERAIGVVLSGRLSDGARGAVRIRQAGGRVFAQDPETCQFPAMPIAAIRSGAVGGVHSPEDLASAVTRALPGRVAAGDASGWWEPFAEHRAS
jgi:two-component system chemotaxis response regulator CheB